MMGPKYQVFWTLQFESDIIEAQQDFDTEEEAGLKLSDVLSSVTMLGLKTYLVEADIREI